MCCNNNCIIESVNVQFSQEGNTLGTTSEIEILDITAESPSEDGFIVLKSETGWSIDDISELVELIEKVKAVK